MKTMFGMGLAFLALSSMAFGRIGPVSQYGQLQAGKAGSKGQIYGACKGVTAGNEVQVQGMSLFWSISEKDGGQFWTKDIVDGLVQKQNIQIIRAPMGVDEDWNEGNYFTKTDYYGGLMDNVVQAAIDNDIYVIIDYHSHKATSNVDNAKKFFETMASKWGKYDNVIFEVFNEPTGQSWSEVKSYAETVLSVIRKYSDNLVVVGNHDWDQHPDDAIGNAINDKNVAYTFHFYAGEDQWRHTIDNQGANAEKAMNAGLSVFVTEWGTSAPSGNGGFNTSYSTQWVNWMNQHKLSGANWSVSTKGETASYFSGSAWSYSQSGSWVNENIFSKLPKSYTACDGYVAPVPQSSASVAKSSSSVAPKSSSSQVQPSSSASVVPGNLNVSGSLTQMVAKGGSLQTVTISGVTSYSRDTWNLHFLQIPQQATNGTVTISGSIPDYIEEGSFEEALTVNGQPVTLKLTVVAAGTVIPSSTSTAPVASSSSQGSQAVGSIAGRVQVDVKLQGRSLQISGADHVNMVMFDMQGRPVVNVQNVQGGVALDNLATGSYIVMLHMGSSSVMKRITLK